MEYVEGIANLCMDMGSGSSSRDEGRHGAAAGFTVRISSRWIGPKPWGDEARFGPSRSSPPRRWKPARGWASNTEGRKTATQNALWSSRSSTTPKHELVKIIQTAHHNPTAVGSAVS